MYQKFNNSNQEKLNTNYAIYSLTDIERITEELNQKDYRQYPKIKVTI